MAEKRKRIHMLDEIRGFAILCMIVHHIFLDIGDVLGLGWGYIVFYKLCTVQPLFWTLFIVISGMCTRLSRNPIKRGAIVLGCGVAVTVVTAVIMPLLGFADCEIYFGILHCLGACMIITGLAMPLIKKIDLRIGGIICALLFFAFYSVDRHSLLFGLISLPEALYQSNIFAPLGFYSESFHSADYFPIIPWVFMFIFGAFFGKFAAEDSLPSPMYKKHSKFLSLVGRNSLWVYLAHQPVIYAVMLVISFIIA